MKIQEMHITPIAIADPPLLNAAGLHAPYALRIVVELVTDDGISGWGEIPVVRKHVTHWNRFETTLLGKTPSNSMKFLARVNTHCKK